ncbi:hexokinase-domain-containing protein [Vararia minispora EC-137]|uniref:Hexokinase-domain-containing protein n=1 Tax=Vararia minispora EC-137 TaxID=1314806 RepID=A0ACB8QCY9_9AGAM|nr:hexokinase-domain-containing protein [Vararia minispora EC-137]
MAPLTATFADAWPDKVNAHLADIGDMFQLGEDVLRNITTRFLQEFNQGLSQYGQAMAMIPTFVTGVPDGTETGTFLALDLGGTNLRVCQVDLNGDQTFNLKQQKYKVSEQLKTGEATALFDYMADSVDAFLTEQSSSPTVPTGSGPDSLSLPLGLTFSFPVEQTALDKGLLLTWTKGFSAKNAIGKDIVGLLQNAFDKKHLHVKCVALVNDTVGALLSRAYTAGGASCGAIFGTGTNGAYVEKVANLAKLGNHPAVARGGDMIVNTEWGGFDNSRVTLPSTPFDNKLDRESINPRFQAFEKFISGMYLGEITRNIFLSLIDAAPKPILFGGKATPQLNKHYGLDTELLSLVEAAWEDEEHLAPSDALPPTATDKHTSEEDGGKIDDAQLLDFTQSLGASRLQTATLHRLQRIRTIVVKHLGYSPEDVSLRDAALVRWACALVSRRAARLSATAVATVAVQMGRVKGIGSDAQVQGSDPIAVGVDGSLIQFYPRFEERMREALRVLIGEEGEKLVKIGLAKDGSGVGGTHTCSLSLHCALSSQ